MLFRNADLNQYGAATREAVGWLVKENDEAIIILWDRSVKPLCHERIKPQESGLVVLRSDIIEFKGLG